MYKFNGTAPNNISVFIGGEKESEREKKEIFNKTKKMLRTHIYLFMYEKSLLRFRH
jgi:hypothetical protein